MTVDVDTKSGTRQVDLQIGPVIFGTALRDSLPFIHFGDFVNQIQFAQISRALNDAATKHMMNGLSIPRIWRAKPSCSTARRPKGRRRRE